MAAAQLRLVDDVVVEQRRGVDHLDDRRQRVVTLALVSAGARGKQNQRRAQPLAAPADDVIGDLPDQRDVGIEARAKDLVDLRTVGGENGSEGLGRHGGDWGPRGGARQEGGTSGGGHHVGGAPGAARGRLNRAGL